MRHTTKIVLDFNFAGENWREACARSGEAALTQAACLAYVINLSDQEIPQKSNRGKNHRVQE